MTDNPNPNLVNVGNGAGSILVLLTTEASSEMMGGGTILVEIKRGCRSRIGFSAHAIIPSDLLLIYIPRRSA